MIPGDPGDVWTWTDGGGSPPVTSATAKGRDRLGYRYGWAIRMLLVGALLASLA